MPTEVFLKTPSGKANQNFPRKLALPRSCRIEDLIVEVPNAPESLVGLQRTRSRHKYGHSRSGERMNASAKYLKSLVGASGFEPEASCAQASRSISWKSFLFNLYFENKRLSKRNSSGKMYENVAPHAWSPPNFPLSEETAKCIRRLLTVE